MINVRGVNLKKKQRIVFFLQLKCKLIQTTYMIWHRTMTHEVRVKLRGGLIMRYVKEKLKHKKKRAQHIYNTHMLL